VGLKPSYGRVSRWGLVAFASSLDCVGPFAREVRDVAAMLGVIAGRDAHDSTALDADHDDWLGACERDARGLRVGVPREYFGAGLDASVGARVDAAVAALAAAGASVVPISLPHTEHAVATYYVLATAEAASNLARYDGVRYGLRREREGADLSRLYTDTRGAAFGAEVKRRILLGTYVLSAGYYDAYYARAQRVRTLIARDFAAAFDEVDVIATPTAPTAAFRLGEKTADPLAMYLADVFTLPASLAGLPAISVPCGDVEVPDASAPLPVGLQLIARERDEASCLRAAAAYEAIRNG
jgi:aspartyl-tRNA(Asn)/glutamyl-tRNA(Gln) amidotransferase subunit A